MKFSISWLKEHLDTNASITEISETLTRIGLEVEEVINPAESLKDFVIAQIVEFKKHPDADKLNLLTVFDGHENFQVVCGAPNAKLGLKGVFAKAGTLIPCYNEVLKVGKIRGIESFGMMCSEKELGLSDSHDGIVELSPNVVVGESADRAFDIDPVIEIAITPNRAECLGVRGIARDLAAAGLGIIKPLKIKEISASFTSPVNVKVEDFDACPVYVARLIKGLNNKAKTPEWMSKRLHAIGLRSISPLVDITNYINYDLARPLHAFDADKIVGDVCIRNAKDGEKFVALSGNEYVLDEKSLGICDDEGVQCLGGIMGGLNKGCSENTTSVFLESALFAPECIARTGRKFQLDSDSRYRYERWVDPKSNLLGSNYATQLILEICGGQASNIIMVGKEEFAPKIAYIRPSRIKEFVGIEVGADKIVEILNHLGFGTSFEGDKIKAISPSWRGDIEGEHDLIEEVLRIIGLDNVPAVSLPIMKSLRPTLNVAQKNALNVKHNLATRGLFETVTWSFANSNLAKYFRKSDEAILLSNPISADLDEMRPSILPNLLLGAKNNISKGYPNVAIFEVGPEFYGRNPGEQNLVACGMRVGSNSKKHWSNEMRSFDVFDAKADALAAIFAAHGPSETAQISTDAPTYYHPNRSGAIRLGKNVLAYFGQLHPTVLKAFGIKGNVVGFEVYLNNIPTPKQTNDKAKKKLELSNFQPMDKDLAFIVNKDIKAIDVVMAVKNADKNLIQDARIFDIFESEAIGQDKKSLAIAFTIQPVDKSLTDKDIEELIARIAADVSKKCGGVLRDGN